jgi:hypothetical protein
MRGIAWLGIQRECGSYQTSWEAHGDGGACRVGGLLTRILRGVQSQAKRQDKIKRDLEWIDLETVREFVGRNGAPEDEGEDESEEGDDEECRPLSDSEMSDQYQGSDSD